MTICPEACNLYHDHIEFEPTPQQRLEYLRGEIAAERISYSEIAELQGLADHIDPSDVELLAWAGVPEHDIPECDDHRHGPNSCACICHDHQEPTDG